LAWGHLEGSQALAVLETFAACLLLPAQGHKSLPWALKVVLGLVAVAFRRWVAHLPLLGREGPHTGLQVLLEGEVRHMAPLALGVRGDAASIRKCGWCHLTRCMLRRYVYRQGLTIQAVSQGAQDVD